MTIALIGIVAVLSASISAYFFTAWIKRRSHRQGWLDDPDNDRKIHEQATPTAGGLGIASGLTLGMAVLYAGLQMSGTAWTLPSVAFWGGALVMLLVGFRDDVRGASFKKKFFVQSAVAYGLLHAGMGIDVNAISPFPFEPYYAALWSVPLTMVWVVGIMNAVNFVDGLDGLAGGIAFVALLAFGVLFSLQGQWGFVATAAVAGGAVLGFLNHNTHPATIFMGDSGSLLLGYLAAVFPLIGPFDPSPIVNLLIPVAVLGVPVLDTATTIVRRMLSDGSIFAPDKDHIHHRLLDHLDERRAVGIMHASACWFGTAAILMAIVPPVWAYGVFGVTLLASVGWVVRLGYFTPLTSSKRLRTVMRSWKLAEPGRGTEPANAQARNGARSTESASRQRSIDETLHEDSEPMESTSGGGNQPAQQPSVT